MFGIDYRSKQMLQKMPESEPFMAVDIDPGKIVKPNGMGGQMKRMAASGLIAVCPDAPVRYKSGGRRNVWILTDLGRYYRAGGINGK